MQHGERQSLVVRQGIRLYWNTRCASAITRYTILYAFYDMWEANKVCRAQRYHVLGARLFTIPNRNRLCRRRCKSSSKLFLSFFRLYTLLPSNNWLRQGHWLAHLHIGNTIYQQMVKFRQTEAMFQGGTFWHRLFLRQSVLGSLPHLSGTLSLSDVLDGPSPMKKHSLFRCWICIFFLYTRTATRFEI